MAKYVVDLERDEDGWWVASIRHVQGCHTQGRTIDEAMRRIREALGLFRENAHSAELEPNPILPAKARQTVRSFQSAKERAEKETEHFSETARKAVKLLVDELGLSLRDAGNLLGISHSRVQQLKGA